MDATATLVRMNATRRRAHPGSVAPRRLDPRAFRRLAKAHGAETPEQMAALFGVHRATIFRWLNNEVEAPALRIADTLGVEVDRLFPAKRVRKAA